MERRGYGGNKNVHLEGFEEDKEKENWQKRSVSSKMGHVSELSSNARCFLLSQRNSSSKAEPMYVDCGYDELLAGIRDDFTMQIANVLILKTLQKTLMKVIQNLILI